MILESAELKRSSEVRPSTLTKTETQSGACYNYFFFTNSLRMFSDNGEHEETKQLAPSMTTSTAEEIGLRLSYE